MSHRNYCFTLNNYTKEEIDELKSLESIPTLRYLCFGKEVGENGTPHLQGVVYFKNERKFECIKKLKGFRRAHYEVTMGSLIDASNYCKKGEQPKDEWKSLKEKGPNFGLNADVHEFGEIPKGQGSRSDLDEIYEKINNGTDLDDIIIENPNVYNYAHRAMHKLEDIRMRQLRRNFMTEGEWIYGPTGVGKSEYAFNDINCYVYPYDNDWWDGYKCQDTVVIDEFRGQIPFNVLLRMVDKHPNFNVRRRCREPMPFVSKKVIITSSLPPWKIYNNLNKDDTLQQLYRRFKIYKIDKNGLTFINPEDPNFIEE